MKKPKLTYPSLLPSEIEEFQQICFEEFGRKLTPEQAADQGGRLVLLFELLALKNDTI